MSVDILGTSWDQCRSMVQYSFTSTETRRLVRTDSPGRPPRPSHSSWTMSNSHTQCTWLNTITGGSCNKYHFSRDKRFVATNTVVVFCCLDTNMLVATKLLSLQNYVCCDKNLSWQNYVCRDKHVYFCHERERQRQTDRQTNRQSERVCMCVHTFVTTKGVFCVCRDKSMLVARKKNCREKIMFIATNICRHKSFVAMKIFCLTSIFLSDKRGVLGGSSRQL